MTSTDLAEHRRWRGRNPACTVITFGTFDLFHIGHLNILRRAAELGDQLAKVSASASSKVEVRSRLVVGVSSDKFTLEKKGHLPVVNETDRMAIVHAIKGVDAVFLEESFDAKRQYILDHKADVFVMGDDWKGHFDYLGDICKVVYLPRTDGVSTTELLDKIRQAGYLQPTDTTENVHNIQKEPQ